MSYVDEIYERVVSPEPGRAGIPSGSKRGSGFLKTGY